MDLGLLAIKERFFAQMATQLPIAGKRSRSESRQSSLPSCRPFLKWAGGKTQLLEKLDSFFPGNVERYFEPFLGGGAVFFHLKHRFPNMQAVLSDVNADLINAYIAVRDSPHELMEELDRHALEFKKESANYQDYFYQIRARHNIPNENQAQQIVERAARMIFLNKTCFNGLWRVNGKNQFNVPIGAKNGNKALYDRENILAASQALQGVTLAIQDYHETIHHVQPGDLVYLDPPFHPRSVTSSFVSYTMDNFGEDQQRELHAACVEANARGVNLTISNSDTPFIRNLYNSTSDFKIYTVQARRAINCIGSRRVCVNEVVVTN